MSNATNKAEAQADPNDFKNSDADLPALETAKILKFEREDWSLFRTLEGLQQKAGVPKAQLARLVLKELTDNALDAGCQRPCLPAWFRVPYR